MPRSFDLLRYTLPMTEPVKSGLWQLIREGRSIYLTVLIVSLMVLIGIIMYLERYWPLQFLYALF